LISAVKSVYLKQAVNEDRARVDHGKLVHELHLVLQRHVKHPRPEPDHQKENVRNEKSENNSKSIFYSDMKNLTTIQNRFFLFDTRIIQARHQY
jgi:hypothetical protein